MNAEFKDSYMERADPEDRIKVPEQARRGVLANIANIHADMQSEDVSDEQTTKLNEELARAEERVRILDEKLSQMKGILPRAGTE